MKVSRPFGPIHLPSQHGHEKMVLLLATRSSTTIGEAGIGVRRSICVSRPVLCNGTSRTNIKIGIILRKTLEKAWKWSKAQREVATSLDATLSKGTLLRWRQMVAEFKKDPSAPNPFQETEAGKQLVPPIFIID